MNPKQWQKNGPGSNRGFYIPILSEWIVNQFVISEFADLSVEYIQFQEGEDTDPEAVVFVILLVRRTGLDRPLDGIDSFTHDLGMSPREGTAGLEGAEIEGSLAVGIAAFNPVFVMVYRCESYLFFHHALGRTHPAIVEYLGVGWHDFHLAAIDAEALSAFP